MAASLLAHLYSRIRGSQEDVATESLQYILSRSEALNQAFTKLLSMGLGTKLPNRLQYACQAVGEQRERPDMAGVDADGREAVLCEMKFYAGLTKNQPDTYLERLRKSGGIGLVFICPKDRRTSLWAKLMDLCRHQPKVETIGDYAAWVNGVRMALLTWTEVIEVLRHTAAASSVESLADIQQLEGFCAQMDSDAFIPFRPEEMSAEYAKKAERYYEVLDETIRLLCSDHSVETDLTGLKASASRKGYARYIYIDGFALSIVYDRDLWKSSDSVETPFWVSVRNGEWKETELMREALRAIPDMKKETTWKETFYALEPVSDATLDEVCTDMKQQILEYLNLFRT